MIMYKSTGTSHAMRGWIGYTPLFWDLVYIRCASKQVIQDQRAYNSLQGHGTEGVHADSCCS